MKPVPRTSTTQQKVLTWYGLHKRPLPWRVTRDPYAITISEVMLQQTQVDRVIPKYHAWLKKFPDWKSLARASKHDVLKLWSGLGYNSRAIRLCELAQKITENGGVVPKTLDGLEALPGIGWYTAGAIMAFAFRKDVSFIDTNIRRVVRRVFFGTRMDVSEKKIAARAADLVPKGQADVWHHALMDLGAMVCISGRPRCEQCPVREQCRAYPAILKQPRQKSQKSSVPFRHTDRFWRGAIIRAFLSIKSGKSVRMSYLYRQLPQEPTLARRKFTSIVRSLENDGLLSTTGTMVRLAQ